MCASPRSCHMIANWKFLSWKLFSPTTTQTNYSLRVKYTIQWTFGVPWVPISESTICTSIWLPFTPWSKKLHCGVHFRAPKMQRTLRQCSLQALLLFLTMQRWIKRSWRRWMKKCIKMVCLHWKEIKYKDYPTRTSPASYQLTRFRLKFHLKIAIEDL